METGSGKYLAAKFSSLARYVILENNSCESRLRVEPLKLGRCSNGCCTGQQQTCKQVECGWCRSFKESQRCPWVDGYNVGQKGSRRLQEERRRAEAGGPLDMEALSGREGRAAG